MLRDFDMALRLTHEPTGISVEWRGWRGDSIFVKQRKLLRKALKAKVTAFKRGERVDLKNWVIEETDLIAEADNGSVD